MNILRKSLTAVAVTTLAVIGTASVDVPAMTLIPVVTDSPQTPVLP